MSKATAKQAFDDLARRLAAGEECGAGVAVTIAAAAGKSMAQLQARCDYYARRRRHPRRIEASQANPRN